MRVHGLLHRAPVVVLAAVVAACGSQAPSLTRQPTPTAGEVGWVTSRVEQPAAIEAAPSTAPPFCSPCHPSVGTYITSVVRVRSSFLALGYAFPPGNAAAWSSDDGTKWTRASVPAPDGTELLAATADAGAVVGVGLSGKSAAVWRSNDGESWSLDTPPGGSGASERATAIARVATGFVAAGYYETATAERHAVFWVSRDARTWTRVAPPPGKGSDEVTGIDQSGGAVVAVGISGDQQTGTAAVWRSNTDGISWQRMESSAFGAGRMLAVTGTPNGFTAVGELKDQTGAAAWYSIDGITWQLAGGQPALANGGGKAVMTAVSDNGDVIAVGWKSDAGNGSAVVWKSTDGKTWSRFDSPASFSGGGMSAVLADTQIVAAGTIGWPDTHAAEVWLGPAP